MGAPCLAAAVVATLAYARSPIVRIPEETATASIYLTNGTKTAAGSSRGRAEEPPEGPAAAAETAAAPPPSETARPPRAALQESASSLASVERREAREQEGRKADEEGGGGDMGGGGERALHSLAAIWQILAGRSRTTTTATASTVSTTSLATSSGSIGSFADGSNRDGQEAEPESSTSRTVVNVLTGKKNTEQDAQEWILSKLAFYVLPVVTLALCCFFYPSGRARPYDQASLF